MFCLPHILRRRLRGKQVQFLYGPATVREEFLLKCHWSFPGRQKKWWAPSQETCMRWISGFGGEPKFREEYSKYGLWVIHSPFFEAWMTGFSFFFHTDWGRYRQPASAIFWKEHRRDEGQNLYCDIFGKRCSGYWQIWSWHRTQRHLYIGGTGCRTGRKYHIGNEKGNIRLAGKNCNYARPFYGDYSGIYRSQGGGVRINQAWRGVQHVQEAGGKSNGGAQRISAPFIF